MKTITFRDGRLYIKIIAILIIGCFQIKSESTEPNKSLQSPKETSNQQIKYKLYTNKKYGFSIEYPESFSQKEPSKDNNYIPEINPNSEEGIDLVSPKWDAEIIVCGYNTNGIQAKDEYEETLRRHPNAAYKVFKGSWFVVSWISEQSNSKDPQVVYLKNVFGSGSCNYFKISYPRSQQERYNPIVKRLSDSFKTPFVNTAH